MVTAMAMIVRVNYEKNKKQIKKIMKRILGFFITLALSTVGYSVMAQTEQDVQTQTETNALRNFAEKNAYGDNWFVSLGGDANLLGGEQDSYLSLGKRLGFGGALNVGKWFNPYFGAQIQIMGGALKGFNINGMRFGYRDDGYGYFVNSVTSPGVHQHWSYPIGGDFTYDENKNVLPPYSAITAKGQQGFKQNFNYGTATIDFLANLTIRTIPALFDLRRLSEHVLRRKNFLEKFF